MTAFISTAFTSRAGFPAILLFTFKSQIVAPFATTSIQRYYNVANSASIGNRIITEYGALGRTYRTTAFASAAAGGGMLAQFLERRKQEKSSLSPTVVGQNVESAMESLVLADCVCFDVDSTVVNEEGIDVLANYLGKGEEVAALTQQAMEGGLKFQDALEERLNLLRPSKASINACLTAKPLELTKGVQDLVGKLHDLRKDVFLVSGGFRVMIEPVAESLGIPKDRIFANTIFFENDEEGSYKGFDPDEPTSKDMGKPRALEMIMAANGYQTMVMVGDGATDAQAKPPAKAFIGFGGVAVREKVKNIADWFITDFSDLTDILTANSLKSQRT